MSMITFDRANTAGSTLRFLPDFLSKVAIGVSAYVTRSRAERQLEALDERLLADIGVSRSQIHQMVWGGRH